MTTSSRTATETPLEEQHWLELQLAVKPLQVPVQAICSSQPLPQISSIANLERTRHFLLAGDMLFDSFLYAWLEAVATS